MNTKLSGCEKLIRLIPERSGIFILSEFDKTREELIRNIMTTLANRI
jgi:hypothetical protein